MACALRFAGQHIHSPFFVFIRAAGRLPDADVLRLLAIGDFVAAPAQEDRNRACVYVTEDEAWVHIADDWRYSLWHRHGHKLGHLLSQKIPEFPVFTCSVGDSDFSYDFSYSEGGESRRRFVLSDPHYDRAKRIVEEDIGVPLSDERPHAEIQRETDYVLGLATAVGVRAVHDAARVRCYADPNERRNPAIKALDPTCASRPAIGKRSDD